MKLNYWFNQRGFSLIEVVASIVLLSIILTSFFSFFFQISLFVQKNENMFEAHNVAQKIINVIQEDIDYEKLYLLNIIDESNTVKGNSVLSGYLISDNKQINDLLGLDISDIYEVSILFKNSYENLIEVVVEVKELKDGNNHAKAYTYIKK